MLLISIGALAAILMLNYIWGLYFKFGVRHYWFFELMHFLGGLFVAMFLANFLYSNAGILVTLGIISILWELHEYLIMKVPFLSRNMRAFFHLRTVKITAKDTVLDLILDLAGGLAFLYLLK